MITVQGVKDLCERRANESRARYNASLDKTDSNADHLRLVLLSEEKTYREVIAFIDDNTDAAPPREREHDRSCS